MSVFRLLDFIAPRTYRQQLRLPIAGAMLVENRRVNRYGDRFDHGKQLLEKGHQSLRFAADYTTANPFYTIAENFIKTQFAGSCTPVHSVEPVFVLP